MFHEQHWSSSEGVCIKIVLTVHVILYMLMFGYGIYNTTNILLSRNSNVMTTPSSLRDLYIDPSSAWSFLPPQPNTAVSPPSPAPVYQWSARPSHNSILDLSPSLDLSEPSGINASQLLKAFAASAVLQYTSTAIVMPWEVGKLLLQVQWVPRDAGDPEPLNVSVVDEDHDDAVCIPQHTIENFTQAMVS